MLSSEEKRALKKGYCLIAGLDESGRGSLAGPVVSAIVLLKKKSDFNDLKIKSIRDSKSLSAKQREEIFEKLKNNPNIEWRIALVSEKTIDRINIFQATILSWKRAIKKLSLKPEFIFLDGKTEIKNLKIKQKAIVKADKKIFLCSLASIIAKVKRDKIMEKLDKKYPGFSLKKHKGYATKEHLQLLKKKKIPEIYRKSFQPVFENLSFKEKVLYIVSKIPKGEILTYKEVASLAGSKNAYRAVGNILKKNNNKKIPCHRVIKSNGKLGDYNKGQERKKELLLKEILHF